ncbi:hypothetical protein [Cryptosporangium minutisporangium]|uniref:hypothetical protein n=1 Tax=Cryptosporangium minutisporangium TaxID=113569 RepID=UPI0031EFC972
MSELPVRPFSVRLAVVASYVSAATGLVAYLAYFALLVVRAGEDGEFELSAGVYPLILLAPVPVAIGRLLVVAADGKPTAHTVARVLVSGWVFVQFVLVVTAIAAFTDDGGAPAVRAMNLPIAVVLFLHVLAQFGALIALVLPDARRYRNARIEARPAPSLTAGRRWIIVAIVLFAFGIVLGGVQAGVWAAIRSGAKAFAAGYYGGVDDEATMLLIYGVVAAVGGLVFVGGTALALPGWNWARRLVFFFGRWGVVTATVLLGVALLTYYDSMELYLDEDATLNAMGQAFLALGFVQTVLFSVAVALVGSESATAWVKRKAGGSPSAPGAAATGGAGVPAFAGQLPPQPSPGYPGAWPQR